jgi:SAM-dependent methyltransferase
MDAIFKCQPSNAVILDLGCGSGSAPAGRADLLLVHADLSLFQGLPNFVQLDAGRLPFKTGSLDAVIANHSLEHFSDWKAALCEIGRVIKRSGTLYVAVPDSTTLSDRLYRWLARGGGHVNHFTSASNLSAEIESKTGLKHSGTTILFSSFSFLHALNQGAARPRKMLLFAYGNERFLRWGSYLLRLLDRVFRTRLSVYGWAHYFGFEADPAGDAPWTNVCIRCGAGHPAEWLIAEGRVRSSFPAPRYSCPRCQTINFFTPDRKRNSGPATSIPNFQAPSVENRGKR